MKEKNFKDRVPTYPGRVKLIPVEGQPNTYDMIRADAPTEEGTPIDKAAFDSIIKSRLTGRYYPLTVTRATATSQTATTDLLDTGTWTEDSTGLVVQKDNYKIEASSISSTAYPVSRAVDKDVATSWTSLSGTTHTFAITFPVAIELKKISLILGKTNSSASLTTKVQGSTDKSTWTDLLTFTDVPGSLKQYIFTKTGAYQYYRLHFTMSVSAKVSIYTIKIGEYTVTTYNNKFVASDDMPTTWETGQSITIQTPTFDSYALSANTFMGITCNTLLQPNKKYELRYNGTSFDSKEV